MNAIILNSLPLLKLKGIFSDCTLDTFVDHMSDFSFHLPTHVVVSWVLALLLWYQSKLMMYNDMQNINEPQCKHPNQVPHRPIVVIPLK